MKRLIQDNANRDGSLDNNKIAIAILQYRNTPLLNTNLSPAQILFHRKLKDAIPTHPSHYRLHKEWVLSAKEREECYANQNKAIAEDYNRHARTLEDLTVGTHVLLQEGRRWKNQGIIVDVLPFRQYRVRMLGSGRVTLRNRRFLKKCMPINPRTQLPPLQEPSPSTIRVKVPRALKNLADYNKKGLKE